MMLDTMATRYTLLPSEVLSRADSLDVLVMDTAIQWHNAQHKKAQSDAEGKPMVKDLSDDQLKTMLAKVRK